jgi:hypothetical protein
MMTYVSAWKVYEYRHLDRSNLISFHLYSGFLNYKNALYSHDNSDLKEGSLGAMSSAFSGWDTKTLMEQYMDRDSRPEALRCDKTL